MRIIDADAFEKVIREKLPLGLFMKRTIPSAMKAMGELVEELEKAPTVNEWHYPSKGDYPSVGEFDATSHLVLVFWWNTDCNGKKAKVYGLDRWCEQRKEWDNYPQHPIAWQPLPTPPKEEV